MVVVHQLIIIDIIIITNKILRPMTCNNDTPNNPYKCNASNNCNKGQRIPGTFRNNNNNIL